MERRPTQIRTTLAGFLLTATLIAPWALAQDPDPLAELRRQAEQGDGEAQGRLGAMYSQGLGVPEDDTEAVRWLRLAADQGRADAQFLLGVMYAEARGVPQDDAEAARWYRLAANQGNATAQYNLGFMYYDGRSVLKDSMLAHMWPNIAGANGNETARESRDNLERELTPAEITRATELARECMASGYESCGR